MEEIEDEVDKENEDEDAFIGSPKAAKKKKQEAAKKKKATKIRMMIMMNQFEDFQKVGKEKNPKQK